ncbi:MAG: class I SAM-dependent methyltransferase [Nocardioidaceae bacterium]
MSRYRDEAAAVNWYDELGEGYQTWSAHMSEDIPLLRRAGAGRGRTAGMLDRARADGIKLGVELELRLGDMRDLLVNDPAALVCCPFRSLLHLPTWADRRRTFEAVFRALRPGGRFAWNAFPLDHRAATSLDGQHHSDPVPHTVRYSVGTNRVDLILDSGATTSRWWATLNEWLGLIETTGFQLEHAYGGFDQRPLDDGSGEYVFVCRRPEAPKQDLERERRPRRKEDL